MNFLYRSSENLNSDENASSTVPGGENYTFLRIAQSSAVANVIGFTRLRLLREIIENNDWFMSRV